MRKSALIVVGFLAVVIAACSWCPVPGGCAPVTHGEFQDDGVKYEGTLRDASTGRIVSGYSPLTVVCKLRNAHDEVLSVGADGQFAVITGVKHPIVGIAVVADGYEPYSAGVTEGQRQIDVRLRPLTTGGYTRYTGAVTDAVTGKPISVRAARLYFADHTYQSVAVDRDGTFDLPLSDSRPPRRIAVVARGYAGFDRDIADGERQMNIALRPLPGGTEVLLGGIVKDASTHYALEASRGVVGRLYFDDSTDELLWMDPSTRFSFLSTTNRLPKRIVVTAPGYKRYDAEWSAGQTYLEVLMERDTARGGVMNGQ